MARLIPNSHDFVLLYNKQTSGTGEDLPTTSTKIQMKVVGLLDDGSVLSTEMEDLCANQSIYVIVTRAMSPNDEEVDKVLDEETRDFL